MAIKVGDYIVQRYCIDAPALAMVISYEKWKSITGNRHKGHWMKTGQTPIHYRFIHNQEGVSTYFDGNIGWDYEESLRKVYPLHHEVF